MATKIDTRAVMQQDAQMANNEERSIRKKTKCKSKSARRRLDAMMNNVSLHFSDTDSEGELMTITNKIGKLNPAMQMENQCNPLISVTVTNGDEMKLMKNNLDYLIAESEAKSRARRVSIVEAFTDVDEIYSDIENDEKDSKISLNIANNDYQEETDVEDLENDEDIQEIIYVTPKSDILMDLYGETTITKEGNGPFSVEVRNQLSREQISVDKEDIGNIPDMPDTEDEDMNEELVDEIIQCRVYDLDFLTNSQTIMRNKIENTLYIPDKTEETINDCHTDVEDID